MKKTLPQLKKELQVIVNKYVRLRDEKEPCISCQRRCEKGHAGHYIAQGASGMLRFNEDNIHKQCPHCNVWKHGNPIEYRINLIKKIGLPRVELLEDQRHEVMKWTREQLEDIKKYYQQKLKDL